MQSLTSPIFQKVLILPKLPQISLRLILLIGIFLIGLLFFSYVFQVSQLTRASFSVADYEKKLASLIQENKDLEMNFSRESSLANLESLLKSLNYVEVGKIHYIQLLEGTMATK